MRVRLAALLLIAGAPALVGYTRSTFRGQVLTRPRFVRFYVSPAVAPGLKNTNGDTIITAESDPVSALAAAMDTWNTVPSANIGIDMVVAYTGGMANMISFDDTAETRSLAGSAIAITVNTLLVSSSSVEIAGSEIVFNPVMKFATTPTLDCFDIQAIATHELGHALGAGHSVLSSATMFAYASTEAVWPRALSSDDVAFANEVYPRNGPFAVLLGTLAYASGTAMSGGAVVLVINPDTGFIVAPYASGAAYSTGGLPAGNYFVVAFPPEAYQVPDPGSFTAPDWQATFYGGQNPQTIAVKAGGTALANITIPDGPASFRLDYANVGATGLIAQFIPSGTTVRMQFWGTGFTHAIRSEDIAIYGPGLPAQPDSVDVYESADPGASSLSFAVNVPAQDAWPDAVVAIHKGALSVVCAGVRVMQAGPQLSPGDIVNAASLTPEPVAPGEIVSLFGSGIGPETAVNGALGPTGTLSTVLSDTAVEFDGQPAPLFYAESTQINAQVPFEVAGNQSVRVRVRYLDRATEMILPVATASPAIFGFYNQPAVLNQDGSQNTAQHPARRGETIAIFGTGQGVVDPPLATGAPAPAAPLSRADVSVIIGGQPARVDFGGMAPGFAGLLQVNAAIANDSPAGQAELQIIVNGFRSGAVAIWIE